MAKICYNKMKPTQVAGCSPATFWDKEMKTVKIKAYAKVNLTLEIVGESGGYHMLDSLVASVDIFDLIVLKKRKDKLSCVTMKGMNSESIPPENNNALKAAEAFSGAFGCTGADITIYKNIPMGAGLGGSSADASGVLVGMAKLYEINDKTGLETLANTIGSDVKYMLDGGFARMQGRGDIVEKLPLSKELYFLMILPNTGVSSGACYREYDREPQSLQAGATEKCINALMLGDEKGAGRYLTNDLYPPASRLCNDVKRAYEEALSFSPLGVVMTGSGSAVLAMFETKELCDWAKSRYRGKYKTAVVKTVIPTDEKIWKNPFVI